MLRTWSVRFDAIELTFSVRSRQVPDTPSTSAWPPSLPSVPTSRATRVTSSANDDSWSTIVLIVSASAATSPLASTVIFFDRSPRATAVVTSAMPRTCSVRLSAIRFTDSVRSRHVPDTPLTSAWPPRLPSVPTSRATRVTSSANDDSWSTIVFTVVPMRRNSPLTGWPSIVRAILRSRSPSATASSTLATSVVGRTRSSMSVLSDSTLDSQPPPAGPSEARWSIRPSRPITRRMRAELLLHLAVHGDELVVGRPDLADEALAAAREAAREVAVASRDERLEDLLEHRCVDHAVGAGRGRGLSGGGSARSSPRA